MEKSDTKVIGYWMSEKKSQKVNWNEFDEVCKKHGYQLKKIDLAKSLESQGPMTAFLHKLTDIIVLANQGEAKSKNIINSIETYISDHPELIVIDPLDNVQLLLDRYRCYTIIERSQLFRQQGVFTPSFAEITTANVDETKRKLKNANVRYPFVCKPIVGHGSNAHKMSVVFNEKHLSDCEPPCVAQTFVNHNAILYKIFIVGGRHFVVERPSLKNFYVTSDDDDRESIFFGSSDVSKVGSSSSLTVLDETDANLEKIPPDGAVLQEIAHALRQAYGMSLLGVDVVIENGTGKYAIIDVNAYPGYDGFPDFYDVLLQCVNDLVQGRKL